jgi:dipeptidyl aminopeptidase/acylaminoacyl peptidase
MLKKLMVAALLATTAAVPSAAVDKEDIVVTAKKGRVATAVFAKEPFMRTPRLSPDGKRVALMMTANGVDNLGWYDLDNPNAKPVFFAKAQEYREAGDRTVDSWQWVGNNTIVFTLASREILGGGRADIGRLVAYDLRTQKLTPIAWEDTGSYANIVHTDHDNETVLIQRNTLKDLSFGGAEIIRFDFKTGKVTIVQRPNVEVSTWYVDGKGVVRAGSGGDGDTGKQRLMYRSNEKETLKTVQNLADATFTGVQIYPSIFLDEPDMAIATSNKDGFRKVYKVNMKTMEIVGPPMFQLRGYDVGGVIANEDNNAIAGIGFTTTKAGRRWLDPKLAEIQKALDETFGPGNSLITSTDDGDNRVIARVGASNQAGSFYLFDTTTGKISLLGHLSGILKEAELNPTETIRYKARDGMEIPAVVTWPRHRPHRKNLPIVVLPHGGPFGVRDSEDFYTEGSWHQALAELGYVVVKPNYRGSGGYGRDFVKEGRKPDGYGKKMQDDKNDVVTWFAAQGWVDPKRACIMGWSYGGYAAARGAQRDPDVWRCAIAGAGVYDMAMMNRWDANNLSTFGSKFQDTSDDPNGISSAQNTNGRWAPILIVAGLRDARIPIEQSRTLVSRLKASGKKEGVDFRYIEQPKGTHNLPYEDVHIEWLAETEAWLRRFNPAYIETDPDKEPAIVVTAELK